MSKKRFFRVHAGDINDAHIVVNAGEAITIEADQCDHWFDLFVPCGATGWNAWLFEMPIIKRFKALPDSPYMFLCASVGSQQVPVGNSNTFVAEESGKLYLFANDVDFLRWNNSGHIDVTITISSCPSESQ